MSTETRIEAGRELDAIIAVEVMGWTMVAIDDEETWWLRGNPNRPTETAYSPRDYSTSGACLEVLERMREQGWEARAQSFEREGWACEFTTAPNFYDLDAGRLDGERYVHCEALTLPHAICLAALEADRKSVV